MRRKLGSTAWVLVVLLASGVGAETVPNVAILRVESLDAAMADIETLTRALGEEVTSEELVRQVLAPLGVSDSSWIAKARPIVAVLRTQGMMAGTNGVVAAFPVRDADAALKVLKDAFHGHGYDDPVHTFLGREDFRLFVLPREEYLVLGGSRDLVLGLDVDAALSVAGLPPGNLAVEVFLEPVAPLIQLGLSAGRQAIEAELAEDPVSGAEQGESADSDVDPQAVVGLLDLYFRFINDLVNNTSRIQASLEVGADHVVIHKRLVPRVDSTLAGLLEAQPKGLPDLGQRLDVSEFVLAGVGRIKLTPAFLELLKDYATSYGRAMQTLVGTVDGDQAPWLRALLGPSTDLLDDWLDCYSGDFAGFLDLEQQAGMRVVQLAGLRDPDRCRELMTTTIEMLGGLPPAPDGRPFMTITENALVHRGVSAVRQETRMVFPDEEDTEEAREAISRWFGGDTIVAYSGIADDALVSVAGADAERAFEAAVDRLSRKRRKRGGIQASLFRPIELGAGYFFVFDLERLVDALPAHTSPYDGANLELLRDLPYGAERIVCGARLQREGLYVEAAAPLKLLEAVAALAEEDEDARHREESGKYDEASAPEGP